METIRDSYRDWGDARDREEILLFRPGRLGPGQVSRFMPCYSSLGLSWVMSTNFLEITKKFIIVINGK